MQWQMKTYDWWDTDYLFSTGRISSVKQGPLSSCSIDSIMEKNLTICCSYHLLIMLHLPASSCSPERCMSCSEGHWHTCAEMVLNIDIITVMIAIISDSLSPMVDDSAWTMFFCAANMHGGLLTSKRTFGSSTSYSESCVHARRFDCTPICKVGCPWNW
jgi:hypothetical protein